MTNCAVLAVLLVFATPAVAAPVRPDIEVDPTAYILDGHSLHAGVGYQRLRVDLGAFAMTLPKLVHGHDDLDVSFNGWGVKLQYFLRADGTGGFAGVDGGVLRLNVARPDMRLAERDTQLAAGVNFGWRFAITDTVYATAWLGLGYSFGAQAVKLGDTTYDPSRFTVFPAVHLGYRFR